jgi:hypothetical protein
MRIWDSFVVFDSVSVALQEAMSAAPMTTREMGRLGTRHASSRASFHAAAELTDFYDSLVA